MTTQRKIQLLRLIAYPVIAILAMVAFLLIACDDDPSDPMAALPYLTIKGAGVLAALAAYFLGKGLGCIERLLR